MHLGPEVEIVQRVLDVVAGPHLVDGVAAPLHPVLEGEVGRVADAQRFLERGPDDEAAAAGGRRGAAERVVLFQQHHAGAGLPGLQRRGHARAAAADDRDVRVHTRLGHENPPGVRRAYAPIISGTMRSNIDLWRDTFGLPLEYEEQIGQTRLAMLPVGQTYIELLEGQGPESGVTKWINEKGTGTPPAPVTSSSSSRSCPPATALTPERSERYANANARAGFSTSRRVRTASSTPLARRRGITFTSRWW
jgi:hypothetical protein